LRDFPLLYSSIAGRIGGAGAAIAYRGKYSKVLRGFEPNAQRRDWTKRPFL